MRTIVALVGASGTGKTTLSLHLAKYFEPVISYTTRPIRREEKNGIDHWFVNEHAMPPRHMMLAFTQFGGYHYWASKSQIPFDRPACYVIDEKGLIEMIGQHCHEFRIIPILIKRDNTEGVDQARKDRDKERITLNEGFYQAVIYNNGTLKEFLDNATSTILRLI